MSKIIPVVMPSALLRIDSPIKPNSGLRTLIYLLLATLFIGLAWLADLVLWQYVLLLIISALIIGYLSLSPPILLHISQPPLSLRIDKNWQLLMRTRFGDQLWQAQLQNMHSYGWLISFDFIITEPYQKQLTVNVFRDQVNIEAWRKLNVLATVTSTTAN